MTRIEAPSRLHFGLLHVPAPGVERWLGLGDIPGLPVRSFGGVGLMIDAPGVTVVVRRSAQWQSDGPSADRALRFAQAFMNTLPPGERGTVHVHVERCPEEHTGLGTGTALGLSVARALAIETGHPEWDAIGLARRIGRGERSAVGIHGFAQGGFIVEAGKLPGESHSPLAVRCEFPTDWRILLIQPPESDRWHGDRERHAFAHVGPAPTDVLCRLVLLGMLPALASGDCDTFGEALHEFNARAGEAFAPVQGGTYASAAVAELVAFLRSAGIRGVGQSSWGPMVFGVVGDEDQARVIGRRVGGRATMKLQVTVARAANQGAQLTL